MRLSSSSRHSAGDLRELPGVPLRGEGSCGGGGAPRDSAGSGATEEGLRRNSKLFLFGGGDLPCNLSSMMPSRKVIKGADPKRTQVARL